MLNKGAGSLIWITLALVIFIGIAFFILFTVANIIDQGTKETLRKDVKIDSEEIAGIINVLKSSSPFMRVIYKLPDKECTVSITENDVKFEMFIKDATDFNRASFFSTGVPVSTAVFKCDPSKEKPIIIERSEVGIKMYETVGELND